MGLVKDVKASTAAQHAARAAAEGRTTLLYRLNIPVSSGGASGPVTGAAEVIEAIERQRWQLWQMAYDESQSRHGAVLLLFRMPR